MNPLLTPASRELYNGCGGGERMNRRDFLRGMVATAAGVLIPASVVAEPERRVWALDRTMLPLAGNPVYMDLAWDDPSPEKLLSGFVTLLFDDGRSETLELPNGHYLHTFAFADDRTILGYDLLTPRSSVLVHTRSAGEEAMP